ncbi:hypothetical protein CLOM_g219 [Closterium sp. NIES-68]|nr:hypothetical protein CLOM_g219 [Closterium sp. NIES-68]GJP68022.1 hypothetical protein CLOP_g24779 [Closterium sp. NIES-67]
MLQQGVHWWGGKVCSEGLVWRWGELETAAGVVCAPSTASPPLHPNVQPRSLTPALAHPLLPSRYSSLVCGRMRDQGFRGHDCRAC